MWLVNLQDDEISADTHITTKIPEFCGFSDEQFIPYREKYVKVNIWTNFKAVFYLFILNCSATSVNSLHMRIPELHDQLQCDIYIV